jgi:hypothetical protein
MPLLGAALGACGSAPSETTASSQDALIPKCPTGYTVDCSTDVGPTGKPIVSCVCVPPPPPPPPPPPLPSPTTLLQQIMRVPGPGDAIYDISILSIAPSNTLHAAVTGAESDQDHVYFAVAGKAADGSNPYDASFNDGSTNFFNSLDMGKSSGPSGTPFVLPTLPIQSADTLYFAVTMDSRNDATVASVLQGHQADAVNFAMTRASAGMTGVTTDTESLPWNTGDGAAVDKNNLPIWEVGNDTIQPSLNPAFSATTPGSACDDYTGDLLFSIPGSQIANGLAGLADGATYTFTQTLQQTQPMVCGLASYPSGNTGYPNAQAKATITFQATLHHAPLPNLGAYVCQAGPITPVPYGGAPDTAWIGRWRDAEQNRLDVHILNDPDHGFDVQAIESEATCSGGASPSLIFDGSQLGDNDQIYMTNWGGTIPTVCVSQPAQAGTLEAGQIPDVMSFNLASSNVWLELYTYACTNFTAPPQYLVRYTRTDGSWPHVHVLSDYMLAYDPPLP